MAYRKEIENMTFEFLSTKDYYQHFGDGYCIRMPANQQALDRLLKILHEHNAQWRLYATLTNDNWFHGVHIVFPKNTDADSIMRHICELLEIGSYCIVEGGTQTVVDVHGDVISFADFTEMYD